jgi:hypothetical protein
MAEGGNEGGDGDMTRINTDVVIALLLLIMCTVFFYDTYHYEQLNLSIVGAKLWPRVVLVALFALSAVYLLQSLHTAPVMEAEPVTGGSGWFARNRNVIGCFVLYALFLLSLPYLGMLLAGIAFVFATLTLIGRRDLRSHLLHAAIAVVCIGLVWAVFRYALGVILPEGEILPR